jgi:Zn-dependent protease with chaperone function
MESAAAYYDGMTARRRAVAVVCETDALALFEAGAIRARWPYAALRREPGPANLLRIGAADAPELARLEIAEPALIADLIVRAPQLAKPAGGSTSDVWRIVGWSAAAAVSLALSAWLLVPMIADRMAPLVPIAFEARLADVADRQIVTAFGGKTCAAPAGAAALAKLTERLRDKAVLPMPATVAVLDHAAANAFALPGGRIYVLRGLLPTLANPDELGGILAHEMGHVAHRDGLRKLLQVGGSSFLLGLLFGDVTGAGALIAAGQALIDSGYSREREADADAFAAQVMTAAGRPAQPLGDWLWRSEQGRGPQPLAILNTHPYGGERAAALREIGLERLGPPLLNDAEFASLKEICG